MSAIAWIAMGSLAAWGWLLLGQGFFWRTDQRLPSGHARVEPDTWPRVAVVVPARDEAEVLPRSLPSLLVQDYPGEAEILLVDDGSTDGTGKLAEELALRYGGLPLTVTSPGEPEPGWTGKLWALRHGIALARARGSDACTSDPRISDMEGSDACTSDPRSSARGPEFLLLTDADIAHEPDSLRRLVEAALAHDLDLVSQMARLRVASVWERLVVPAFVYFFAQLYPFRWINRPRPRATAAAGGCVLLRTETAERARVPESIRQAVIDDVSLARAVRRSGGRIWLGLAERVDSVRPYPHLADLWRMISRSAYAQLRHNPLLLAGTVAGLAVVYLAPPVAVAAGLLGGDTVAGWAGGLAWAVMAGTYLPMLRYYRQPLWLAPTLPLTALLYLFMTVDSAVQHYRGRGAAWKGRTYARPEAAPDR
ncbi:glycosyltransferase [Streptomyces sp. Je 1-79]|uniref:glycosyltransferase n=1 Tax=Streptomyces sp. Je 1-79 TaxID=2943847 RepID=UPI0021A34C23|nr:glycosyltransferase [Streptomyces sp. Je 1-79]MCT4353876.1 glycosyltransferase [Streptomyces sp. Je 1-79]